MHGEAGLADVESEDVQAALARIKAKISEYKPSDMYNIDETGLFHKQVPTRTISKEPDSGLRLDKTRLTIALACTADGSHKLPLCYIGHAGRPRCFGNKTGKSYLY